MICFGPDESYSEGRMAYLAEIRSDANPYERHTRQYHLWRDGWIDEGLRDAATCGALGQGEDKK